jgi:WhiB family transcriptional regulator, redox-sensing transcriptional regulator
MTIVDGFPGSSENPVNGATRFLRSFDRTPWMAKAACRGVAVDLFFPDRGATTREAKEVCRGCEVREECLEYSLGSAPEKFGIWGGMSERERRRMRRERRQRKAS